MRIEILSRIDEALLEALARLLPQLKDNAPLPTRAELQALLDDPNSLLLAARRADGHILGLVTLALYRTPSGLRARLEDLVVDQPARGQGLGAALTRAALAQARAHGAKSLALTSNPRRVAANALYQKLGFSRWETNTYIYHFD